MRDYDLHRSYYVEDSYRSESAIIYLPHNTSIAIKQLKPYRDSRFDLRTPAERQACQLEAIRWNRIFTPGIYEGLALLCKIHTSKVEQEHPRSVCIGPILKDPEKKNLRRRRDYVLVMKRLPDAWRLDNLIANSEMKIGRLKDDVFPITDHIVYYYLNKLQSLSRSESARWGNIIQIRQKLSENLQLLKSALHEQQMSCEPYDLFRTELRKILRRKPLHKIFQERLEAGFIRRCHGDLKAPNIWIAPPEDRTDKSTWEYIWLLDAVDFNQSFCYIDVLSDFAMFVIDIEARTASKELANLIIERYLNQTGQQNEPAHKVLKFYLVEKAIVSAAISIKFDKKIELGERYLRIAKAYLRELQGALSNDRLLSGSLPGR